MIEKKANREIRKKEILDAAKKVFLRKGFDTTTMEDIIVETSLSRGGFYYYYKNTEDILLDLMREGNVYRMTKMNEFMATYDGQLDHQSLAEMLVDKMLDNNEFMSLYVIYLQAMKNNEKLKKLYSVLVDETLYSEYGGDINGTKLGDFEYCTTDLFIYLMNTVILGCEILDARETYLKNRGFFVDVVKFYFKYYEKGKVK